MNQPTTVSGTTTSASATWAAIVKIALLLLGLTTLSALVFQGFFSLLARSAIEDMLIEAQFSQVLAIENALLGLTMAPATYGVLAAVTPLVGWWVYARVDKSRQAAVGWGSAAVFALSYVVLGLLAAGVIQRLADVRILMLTMVGLAVIVTYTVFFMGLGFNIARLFRLKL